MLISWTRKREGGEGRGIGQVAVFIFSCLITERMTEWVKGDGRADWYVYDDIITLLYLWGLKEVVNIELFPVGHLRIALS